MKTLRELLDGFVQIVLPQTINIQDLSLDSRQVKTGDLFFAYPGTKVDGRRFIQDALVKGAASILQEVEANHASIEWAGDVPIISMPQVAKTVSLIADRFYDSPSSKMTMIGVTGTNGKTSCCHLIAEAIMRLSPKKVGVLGTVGNGVFGDLQESDLTTLDPISVQRFLVDFVQQGIDTVAMEASSHSLVQGRVSGVHFTRGLFTNLTHDHLDYHKTMEAYAAAKHLLFEMPSMQCGIFNLDDPYGKKWFLQDKQKIDVWGYSCDCLHEKQNFPFLCADDIRLNEQGFDATVRTSLETGVMKSCLLGRFNVSNLLAVVATLLSLNYSLKEILSVVPQLHSVLGRLQTVHYENKPTVVVDFAHTPDALEKALETLKDHCVGKLYCVFGCGGDRDRTKRPEMAQIAERFADRVFVTSDNPRTEDPDEIIKDVMQGFEHPERVTSEVDREKAVKSA
ncbi:MAG: UDP-N-acetylmuramoyl-L-alanyl-D-glutamate--2,6-diaminopimelate ligase, partial [Gammaproteobacteria bacterium]|nr:UDP-N-acetylmuramoyl-L-alanyl-D-glutamate--2,6-diaminopimelate ligase [Gammaproteobacteria bacterium]